MPRARYATLIRTGRRVEGFDAEWAALWHRARELCPAGLPAEETVTLQDLRDELRLGFVHRLRAAVMGALDLPDGLLSLDRVEVHGCGPISLHDDAHNYPDVDFAIVVIHSGGLGVVDRRMRAVRHLPGELLLLDPQRKHALVPDGLTAAQHPYERSHAAVADEDRQFLFLSFDVPRPRLRRWFRVAP